MFCKNCGSELPKDASFCANCGQKVSEEPVDTKEPENAQDSVKDYVAKGFPTLTTIYETPADASKTGESRMMDFYFTRLTR